MAERHPEVVGVSRDDPDARGHLANRLAASRREEREVPDGDEQKKAERAQAVTATWANCNHRPSAWSRHGQPDQAKDDGVDKRGEKPRSH
jgi:hypothetical protein